jgi:hypothetical protein
VHSSGYVPLASGYVPLAPSALPYWQDVVLIESSQHTARRRGGTPELHAPRGNDHRNVALVGHRTLVGCYGAAVVLSPRGAKQDHIASLRHSTMVFASQPAIMRILAVHMWNLNGRCVLRGLTVLRSKSQGRQSRSDPSETALAER